MFFFKDAAVTEGYIMTSCRISAPVLGVVFFLAPVTTFLGGIVPGGSLAAARFGHKCLSGHVQVCGQTDDRTQNSELRSLFNIKYEELAT